MNVKATLALSLVLASLAGPGVAADRECNALGEGPSIPDGAKATEAELVESQAAVKEYVAQGEFYLQCLKATEFKLGDDISEDQQQRLLLAYDQTVEKMQQTSEAFNQAVRDFKAK